MATAPVKLTLRDKVDYVPAFLSIGGTAILASVTGLIRGSDGADTYRHHVAHAVIRKFNSRLNSIQSQSIQPSFRSHYEKWCKANKKIPDIVDTDSGVRGFWVGDKQKAKYVMVYFHGGGFAIGGSDGHIKFWYGIQEYLSRSSVDVAFFYVCYTLSTDAKYPTQLSEAVAAVQYVVEDCHRSPSSLLLGGDSAGGNLAVAVLLHLSTPCPEIDNKFTVTEKLKGLILMAPWLSFRTDWPSFVVQKHKDYIEADVEGRWSAEYFGVEPKRRAAAREVTTGDPDTQAHSPYGEPGLASPESWAGSKCDKILVVYGSFEALGDSVAAWVEDYKKGIGKERVADGAIEVSVGKSEVHIAPIVWPMFGDRKETESGATIKKWMLENLS